MQNHACFRDTVKLRKPVFSKAFRRFHDEIYPHSSTKTQQKVAIAEAEAKATVATATAQAESIRVQSNALAQSKEILDLKRIEVERIKAEKWDGRLPQNIYAGAPIPFLQVGK